MKKLCYISVGLESNLQLPAALDNSGIFLGLCHFHYQQSAMALTLDMHNTQMISKEIVTTASTYMAKIKVSNFVARNLSAGKQFKKYQLLEMLISLRVRGSEKREKIKV